MVILNGRNLTIAQLEDISRRRQSVRIAPQLWQKIRRSRRYLDRKIAEAKPVYGLNTGFGALAQIPIRSADRLRLQRNIILSHNAGVGPPFPVSIVRSAMTLRINTLIQGNSGVSAELIKLLLSMLNHDIVPIVPTKGSVGASGDLAPMAAIGAAVIGRGQVMHQGRLMSARKAMTRCGLQPHELRPKEGLSLLNGTQFSTAVACQIWQQGSRLLDIADLSGAMSLEGLKGTDAQFQPWIFKVRPHPGAVLSGRRIRDLLRDSKILSAHRDCKKVQDPYSLRCMAQVHGAVRDLFNFCRRGLEIEINSVTDNPLVFSDLDLIVNGGNFHGEPIAFVSDIMAMGLAEIAGIAERRIFRLLDHELSALPPFLARHPGLHSGLMMAQTTAAALVSQNKQLAHPASVDSIPTSADQEDHVSMSMNAGLKAMEILNNTTYVLAIELLCAAQAIELLAPLRTSPALEKIIRRLRREVPFLNRDRELTPLIERIRRLIEDDRLLD